ncbi:MAG: hypothetical protein JJU08_03890 [Rhodobacteraceae bacterium]|nr:hypothetical protein [Paracoccaceae bacterium]
MMRARATLIHVVACLVQTGLAGSTRTKPDPLANGGKRMNKIIYIIGLVVVVLFLLSFFGLR